MTLNEFVEFYAENSNMPKTKSKEEITRFIENFKAATVEDGGVDIYGFVKFEKVHKDACEKRNPRTGEMAHVDAKFVPKAKFSSAFKREVNA